MRIAELLVAFFMNLPVALAAETLCAVIPETLSLGRIESKNANVDFKAGVEVSCRNTSSRGVQTKVLIHIAQTEPVMIAGKTHDELRTRIGFGSAKRDLASSLCVNVNLGPDESTVINLPILVTLRMDAPHHDNYSGSVPISAQIMKNSDETACR